MNTHCIISTAQTDLYLRTSPLTICAERCQNQALLAKMGFQQGGVFSFHLIYCSCF